MTSEVQVVLGAIRDYYSSKVLQHGATARGVDWNSEQSQELRFAQLAKLLPGGSEDVSVADLGCGYGGMLSFLRATGREFHFTGVDVSPEMIAEAVKLHSPTQACRFVIGTEIPEPVDYVFASGIFNVRQDAPDEEWLGHIHATIGAMDRASRRGFAFNCLTSWSDRDKKRPYLYYADPAQLFDHCMRNSRHVALLHDYGLYEFTLIVRK